MAVSDHRHAARRAWHSMQTTASRYGGTWLVLGTKRMTLIAAALDELGDLGSEGLLLAIEGYVARTDGWDKQLRYLTPETIYRPSHLAQNVEAGVTARRDARQRAESIAESAAVAASLARSSAPLWD